MLHYTPDLAVLALAQRDVEPGVLADHALQARLDRPVVETVDGNAVLQRRELRFIDVAMNTNR